MYSDRVYPNHQVNIVKDKGIISLSAPCSGKTLILDAWGLLLLDMLVDEGMMVMFSCMSSL